MKSFTRTITCLLAGSVIGAFLAVGQGVFAERSDEGSLPLEDLRTFTEVFARIKSDYVEPIDDKALLENAIRGMLSGLDPHSTYLVPDDYQELQAGTSGEFGGLGIEVGMEDGFVKVIAPIDDTPAQRAGVEAGDLVIRLDDTPVKGMSLAEAVKVMRGEPGTDIVLTIVREGVDRPIRITITRDVIHVTSVRSRSLEPGYGYIRISQFQLRTGESLREEVGKLREEAGDDEGIKGVVLDLRNNPGGVLNAAVSVSDAFLDDGIIVYTDGRMNDAKLTFNAKGSDILDGIPLVVLVNAGSASASEIVAGALQDHGRAVIMGEKTFGKGSVQTILPLENGSALKLTTARYYTPSGTSIQARGIVPDILLDRMHVSRVDGGQGVKESDLARHLKSEGEDDFEAARQTQQEARELPLAQRDFALYEALNLLKGLHILNNRS